MANSPALAVTAIQIGALQASFSLRPGECIALHGASGSGKTRLLRGIADLDPVSGMLTAGGISRDAIPAPLWRRRVAYLSAEPGWWAETASEHFRDWRAVVPEALGVGLRADHGDRRVRLLSTGERQRLALLRALETGPDVLLLDEPTAALDPAATVAVEALLADRLRQGLAIVWATHSVAQGRRVASRSLEINGHGLKELRR